MYFSTRILWPISKSMLRTAQRAAAAFTVVVTLMLGIRCLSAEDASRLSDIADRVSASVVSVIAEKVDTGQNFDTDMGGSNLRQGTGLVLTADGLIVAAAPVVEKVGKITVKFTDGRQAAAQVVGRDARSGLALLKETTASGLSPAKLYDAHVFHRGTSVFSIGDAYGLENSLALGVIAAVRRTRVLRLILQTNMVVQPGSMGASLFDMKGEVSAWSPADM